MPRRVRGGEDVEPATATTTVRLFDEVLHETDYVFSGLAAQVVQLLQDERFGPLQECEQAPADLLSLEAQLPTGASARMATKVFRGTGAQRKVRRARVTLVHAGDQLQALNAVVYPTDKSELPLLGLDIILIGGQRLLVGMDFSPLSRDPKYLQTYCEAPLGAIRDKFSAYDGLLTTPGTKLYGEDPEFFSPAMFFSRADLENLSSDGPLAKAFEEICDEYAELLSGAHLREPISLRTPGEVRWQHTRYDAWHERRDPAIGIFKRMFGEEVTQHFVDRVLFPWAKTKKRRAGAFGSGQRSILRQMQRESMKLHTRSQAPKHGQTKEPKRVPMSQRSVTKESMLQYLVDSQVAYQAFEDLTAANSEIMELHDTGLERVEVLREDIAELAGREGLQVPEPSEHATSYAKRLRELAATDAPRFVCHWYNHHFAHTAGGRMIYAFARKKAFGEDGGAPLGFWEKYPKAGPSNDYKELLAGARARVEACAKDWSPEARRDCAGETPKAFEMSGGLLKSLWVDA
eukprot:CAMPEP_0115174724 /NCGR_PEP_ID=MMETSP0270-20121206/3987_1 /TAXON_ID=71861 /ORGANISM="Scrippsiella trochoidea, Strain CCMP3099" /LENGTH=517 /DNA_ID=CAMNT_0002587573 /DNA_START=253 /DNA_END=1806 /DNA_ORIENTATION=-